MRRRLWALFNPRLPREVWLLQLGVLVNFLGNGMVAPFLVIYLHFGRGLPLSLAASAVALGGVTAIASGLAAGSLADRFGPRYVVAVAMACNAMAYLLYTQVTLPWQAFGVGLLVGVGTGAYGPSTQSLIASLVRAEDRPAAFAQNRVTSVVGLGVGGMIGGLIGASGLAGYRTLLRLDVVTFLVMAAVPLLLGPMPVTRRTASGGAYRDVLRDQAFMRLIGVNILMVAAGIAPMLVLLPAFAKTQVQASEPAIGAIYAANTLTVVLAQMPLTRLVAPRNPMLVLRTGALIWVASWAGCLVAGGLLSGPIAVVGIGLAAIVYATGECLYFAIMLPTATALAPDHLRGRYLGAMALSWQAGFLIGPSLGGLILGAVPLALPVACASVCLVAAAGTVAVERSMARRIEATPVAA